MARVRRIVIDVPAEIDDDLFIRLFDTIAEAVYDWEPDDRDDWDAFMYSHITDDLE